jgi:GNAT superfamily N-acetyltransferase
MTVRVAGVADVDAVVATITTAFFHDPLWGPAFPDAGRRAEQASAFWRFLVTASLRHGWTMVTPGVEAAAVWIPPGAVELTADQESALETLLVDTVGSAVAGDIGKIFEIFEAAHPHEPHFYLSLLGTHDAYRGKGLGMALLRENLTRIDEAGYPAYLESSNPANDARYASLGFLPRSHITAPTGQMTTMWRPAR